MGEIIDFSKKRQSKEEASQNELELVTNILAQEFNATEKAVFIKEVKKLLTSKGVSYRISHEEVNVKIAPKKATILFEPQKCGFVFGSRSKKKHVVNGWTIEFIGFKRGQTPIYLVDFLLKKLREVVNE